MKLKAAKKSSTKTPFNILTASECVVYVYFRENTGENGVSVASLTKCSKETTLTYPTIQKAFNTLVEKGLFEVVDTTPRKQRKVRVI